MPVEIDIDHVARLARLEPSSSAFILYLGARRTWPGLPHHTIAFGPDFARDLRERGVEKITISKGVSREEIRALVAAYRD